MNDSAKSGPTRNELDLTVTRVSFTDLPHNQLLRRYLAGETTDEELSDGAILRALATSVVELQEIVVKTVRRFGPLLTPAEEPREAG